MDDDARPDGVRALIEIGEEQAEREGRDERGDGQMPRAEDGGTDERRPTPAHFLAEAREEEAAEDHLFEQGREDDARDEQERGLVERPQKVGELLRLHFHAQREHDEVVDDVDDEQRHHQPASEGEDVRLGFAQSEVRERTAAQAQENPDRDELDGLVDQHVEGESPVRVFEEDGHERHADHDRDEQSKPDEGVAQSPRDRAFGVIGQEGFWVEEADFV